MDKKIPIQAALIRQLYSTSYISQVTSVILAAIFTFALQNAIHSNIAIAWFSMLVCVAIFRSVLALAYQRETANDEVATALWMKRFRLGVLISGIAWGSSSVLLFPVNQPQEQAFLVAMLTGLTAGGLITYSVDLLSASLYVICILLPLIVRLFFAGNTLATAMGLAIILYLGFMIINLRHINRNMNENISLRFEAAEREEAVRVSEQRYRLLFDHSPVGIFLYDTHYVITYCNDRLANILNNSVERLIGLDMKMLKDQSLLPAMGKALQGEVGHYEGHYTATLTDAKGWTAMICAPSTNQKGEIEGGVKDRKFNCTSQFISGHFRHPHPKPIPFSSSHP